MAVTVGSAPMSVDPQLDFLEVYSEYVKVVVEPARYRLRALLSRWKRAEYWESLDLSDTLFTPSPIQSAISRIKRPESAFDKMLRKPDHYDPKHPLGALRAMHDVLGGRIVTYFVTDLAMIDQAVRRDQSLEVCPDDPPIAYLTPDAVERLGLRGFQREQPQSSGYTSLHYVLRFKDPDEELERPWFELQVRTLAEHSWAEIQHILGYKPDVHVPTFVRRQLELLARHQAVFDEEFELLRDVLDAWAQSGQEVADDEYLTAANLPSLLQEAGLKIPRDWVSQTLKLLHSRGVDKAGRFRRLVSLEEIRSLVSRIYKEELGRAPRDMERISTLANLADLLDGNPANLSQDGLTQRIKAQLHFDREWQSFLQTMASRNG
jgi:putative GTP pyrophosphokinase